MPVSSEARAAVQMAELVNACVKRIPLDASLSSVGVSHTGAP